MTMWTTTRVMTYVYLSQKDINQNLDVLKFEGKEGWACGNGKGRWEVDDFASTGHGGHFPINSI